MFRLIFQFFVSAIMGIIAAEISAWVFVRIYAQNIGVPLQELSEDYGMAMIGIAVEVGVFLMTTICLFAVFLHRANKRK